MGRYKKRNPGARGRLRPLVSQLADFFAVLVRAPQQVSRAFEGAFLELCFFFQGVLGLSSFQFWVWG